MFNIASGMCGKLGSGMCRLSMNGDIAVKTSTGYKSYNLKTGNLVNCSGFLFSGDAMDEFFMVMPTNKVEAGDIILVGGKPKCVIEPGKKQITVIDYEDSSVKTILPERHVFMGNTYFYGKVISMFGSGSGLKGEKGMKKIMKMMMLGEMMKGGGTGGDMKNMMVMSMLMGGGMEDMFDGMFDFDDEEETEAETEEA